jgi:hypothetical protein
MQSNLPDEDRILEAVKFATFKTWENKNQIYGNPLADLKKISSPGALTTLIEGNERFTLNLTTDKDLLSIVNTLRERRHAFYLS